jgi:hypothetical protein
MRHIFDLERQHPHERQGFIFGFSRAGIERGIIDWGQLCAYSDEVGQSFRREAGHLFRYEVGQ